MWLMVLQGLKNFKTPIHIEVTDASKAAVNAIEAIGGSVKRVYFTRLGLRAHLKVTFAISSADDISSHKSFLAAFPNSRCLLRMWQTSLISRLGKPSPMLPSLIPFSAKSSLLSIPVWRKNWTRGSKSSKRRGPSRTCSRIPSSPTMQNLPPMLHPPMPQLLPPPLPENTHFCHISL